MVWNACPVRLLEKTTQFFLGCHEGYTQLESTLSHFMFILRALPLSMKMVPPWLARTWKSMCSVL